MDTVLYLIGFADDDRDPISIRDELGLCARLAFATNVLAMLLWGMHLAASEKIRTGLMAVESLRGGVLIGEQTALAALDAWGMTRLLIPAAAVLAGVLLCLRGFTDRFHFGPRSLHRALAATSVTTVVVCWHVVVLMALITLSLATMVLLIAGPAVAGMLVLAVAYEAVQRRDDP